VVGKGNPAPYQRLAERLGCAGRVKFWGPQEEVASFYQAATVLALPTLYDPCSNVVLESLACGTPVVTTAANGASEFLAPGRSGEILTQPDDVASLAQALAAYLERGPDPERRLAAQEAVAHLSWEATVAQTLAVLEEAAAEGGG
jgi:UDP-glucose:(heptosyl)LPS alpha-1,3-glucosyltransferase